jgi:hypothetical protein
MRKFRLFRVETLFLALLPATVILLASIMMFLPIKGIATFALAGVAMGLLALIVWGVIFNVKIRMKEK